MYYCSPGTIRKTITCFFVIQFFWFSMAWTTYFSAKLVILLLLIFCEFKLKIVVLLPVTYIYAYTKLQLNLDIPHLTFCLKYTLRFTLLYLMILKLNFNSIYRSLGCGGVTGTSWLPVCSRTPTTSASRSSTEKALTTGPCRSSTYRSGTTARTNVRYVKKKNYCLLLFSGESGSSQLVSQLLLCARLSLVVFYNVPLQFKATNILRPEDLLVHGHITLCTTFSIVSLL